MTLRDDGAPEISPPLGGVAMVNLCGVLLLVLFIFGRPAKEAADRFAQDLYSPTPAAQVAASQPPTP